MLTEADKKTRSNGIGSSEIAMLVYVEGEGGEPTPLSPWGGRHKLWRKKTGREQDEQKDIMRRGQYMEPGLLQWYADDNEVELIRPPSVRHRDYPYVVDSCDGLTFPKGSAEDAITDRIVQPLRCVEAKTSHWSKRKEWGSAGTDDVPDYYLVQCQWHLGAHKPDEMICDLPMDDGSQRRDYHIAFNEELYISLVSLAEKFWKDHVEKDVEPPIDDYSDTTTWLSKYLKQRSGMGYLDADEETAKLMLLYREKALHLKDGEAELEELKEKLMRAIGEYDGIIIEGTKQKITWKRPKESQRTDWKGVSKELCERLRMEQSVYNAVCSTHQTTKEGSRRWWPKALLDNS